MSLEEDDDEDEEVLWCSWCTGHCKSSQCACNNPTSGEQQSSSNSRTKKKKSNDTSDDNNCEETGEEHSLSGLPPGGSGDSGEHCCPCPCPFPRSQSFAFENIPMTALGASCATSGTHNLNNLRLQQTLNSSSCTSASHRQHPHVGGLPSSRVRRHPLIPSKTIVVPPTSSSSLENLVSLASKATSIACLHDARIIHKAKILASVPNKLSSTGVRILYLCDVKTGETDKTGTNS